MGAKKNYSGKKYNKLTFIEPTLKRGHAGCIIWKLECECKRIIYSRPDQIVDGSKSSCGICIKDFAGQKFAKLTFIKPTKKKNKRWYRNGIVWELRCDCNSIIYEPATEIISGRITSCGCNRSNDYIGQKFGKLTFIKKLDERDKLNGGVVWELKCECGKFITSRAWGVVNGHTKSCGCISRKYTPYESSARGIWRGHYFDCDFNLFLELSQQNCYYCNTPPSRMMNVQNHSNRKKPIDESGNFTYNGLDRIDNTKGHLSDNIVPCCKDCNTAKMQQTLDEFIVHIEKMYHHTRRLVKK